jgi:hypothetical protein
LISYLRKVFDLGYDTGEFGSSEIQTYHDDMILIKKSEQNLQTLINRSRIFFDFIKVKFSLNKCEVMAINPYKGKKNIIINNVMKEYVASNKFVKYPGVLIEFKKIIKMKFLEAKVQKNLKELDKVKYSGLALNQMIRTIRCYILNKLYYVFENMNRTTKYFKVIDGKMRNVVNRFINTMSIEKFHVG